MALREELLPWDSQPTEVAQVSPYPGLKNFWNFGDRSGRCLVTGRNMTYPANRAAMTWVPGGVRLQINTYTTTAATLPLAFHVTGAVTFLVGLRRTSGVASWSVMNPNWDGWYGGDKTGSNTNNTDFSGGVTPTVGPRQHTYVDYQAYTTSGANDFRGAINGGPVALDSVCAAPTPTNPNSTCYLGTDASGTNKADVWVAYFGVLNRAVSDDELIELSRNPWGRLLQPRRIWVPVSAGGGSTDLTVADSLHAHSADALVLTSLTALTVAEALHAHSADAATLVAGSVLAVAESSHGHAADGLTLTSAHALAVADAAHGHAADNLTLTAASVLALQEALHAHAADATALTMDSALAVAETLHVQAADNPVLGVAGTTNLVVADAAHAHSADVLALTSAHALVVADAIHGHSVEGLTLSVASVLAIQEALHAHAAENLALETTGSAVLLLADSLHAHTSDGAALTVDAWLVAADAAHGHSADNVVFTFGGAIPTDTLPMMVPLQNSYMLVAPERSLMIVRV